MNVENEYLELLKSWCDGLIRLQFQKEDNPRLDGGIFCPSCMMIHGRCHDAIYPMMYLADRLKEKKYLEAAKLLFQWSGNLLCDDGSYYNDAQNDWMGITVFSVIALTHALEFHASLLTAQEKEKWEARLNRTAEWVFQTITPQFDVNINYHAACAEAMALTGMYFHREKYLKRSDEMADFCMQYISKEGLFFGEGKPRDDVSPKGCRPVDIGYNVEESLASLLSYGTIRKNKIVRDKVKHMLWVHLEFMNPDGGWDNTMGTRNYKWSYWGSRTSDGCQLAYGLLGDEEPVFSDASYRNFKLYKRCTHDGLLYGGIDYYEHGELPCVHHTFCKAKALALLLDFGAVSVTPSELPSEHLDSVKYWPVIDTYRIARGGFIATVTAYDIEYRPGGHASGGAMTMLWHRSVGMMMASSTVEYTLIEPTNGQLSLKKNSHRPMTMRLETCGKPYLSSAYDFRAVFKHAALMSKRTIVNKSEDRVSAEADGNRSRDGETVVCLETFGHLTDRTQKRTVSGQEIEYRFRYQIEESRVMISAETGVCEETVRWVIPVVGKHEAGVERLKDSENGRETGVKSCSIITHGNDVDYGLKKIRYRIQGERGSVLLELDRKPAEINPIFFLNGGFEGWEVILSMEQGKESKFWISAEE